MSRINRKAYHSLFPHRICTVRNLALKAALLQCVEFQLGSAFHVLYDDSSIKFCYSNRLLNSRFFSLMSSCFDIVCFWVHYFISETLTILVRLPLVENLRNRVIYSAASWLYPLQLNILFS